MNRKKTDIFSGTDWLEIQKKYLEACQVFNQVLPDMTEKTERSGSPVNAAMEYWWKSVSPYLTKDNLELVSKILEQCRIYYTLGEQFVRLLNEINKLDKTRKGWESLFNQQFEELKNIFGKSGKEANESIHKIFGAWQLMPLDTLQRTFSLSSVMPGDFLGDVKQDPLLKVTDKFLSMPGVGYTRESQEQIQEGIRLWNEYQLICQEYNQAIYKIGARAIDIMHDRILAMAREGKELKSLREIYDLWIDCNEESYASYVYTREFSELYGRLTNALMAVKQHGRILVDEYLGAMNVPTYKGIHTLQKRQHDMRREQKTALKKIQELDKELSALRGKTRQADEPAAAIMPSVKPAKTRGTAKKKKQPYAGAPGRNMTKKAQAPGKIKAKQTKNDNMIVIKI